MLIHVNPRNGVPVFRQIMEQITDLILSGRLTPGEQITSVRELAKEISVNPMTISKAYAFLERDGLLERRRGKGLFVAVLPEPKKKDQQHKVLAEMAEELVCKAHQLESSREEVHRLVDQEWTAFEKKFVPEKKE